MGITGKAIFAAQVALPLAVTGASASTAGCPSNPGFTYNPEPLYLLNGYAVEGPLPSRHVMVNGGPATRPSSPLDAIPPKDILSISIICQFQADEKTMRHAVAIVTKSGVDGMLVSYLNDLVAMQEKSLLTTGRYASDLQALRFFTARMMIPLTVTATDGGWSATARYQHASQECLIAVGNAELPRPGMTAGQVSCFAI